MAEAMGIKFLAQENNSSRKSQPGIEPGHQAWNLTIARLMLWQHCPLTM